MNKFKLFAENFFVYGLGGIINKIIPLIMVPIVTSLMPSTFYYGLSDMYNTVVSLTSAIAIMGVYDAMYRLFFEKEEEEYKKKVCSTALIFTIFMSLVVFFLMVCFKNYIANKFFEDSQFSYLVYLSAIATMVGASNSIISAPTRMQNKRKIFLVANVISPLLSYGISIPLLVKGYYIIALPLAMIVSGVTMEFTFYILNRSWFKINMFDFNILKQILIIAVPLLPNVLLFWIFNSCDKLMITNFCGLGQAGIYSIGSKLGHASQLIYTAFAGGWQFFVFSTMKEENQVQSNTRIYEYLGVISYISTLVICAISYDFYDIVFSEKYISGYVIAPYLFLAPLLQMLYQVGNSQFIVIKKTWPGMFILSSGVIVNIIANFILIPIYGIEGAAIATLLGYVTSCIIDILVLKMCKLMNPSVKFLIVTLFMIFFFMIWRLMFSKSFIFGLGVVLVYSVICIFTYKSDILWLLSKINGQKKCNL